MALHGSQYSAAYKKRLRAGLGAVLKFVGRSRKRLHDLADSVDELDRCLEQFVNWVYRRYGKKQLSAAKHGLLAVQRIYPQHRRRLHRAWQSVQACEDIVEVNVRVPLPLSILCGLVIAARAHAGCASSARAFMWDRFSVCLELAFFGLLRPGEVLQLRKCDVSLPHALLISGVGAVVRVQAPKNRRTFGKHQFVYIDHVPTCDGLRWLTARLADADTLWGGTARDFRAVFKQLCTELQVGHVRLAPASLRAGGASHLHLTGLEVSRLKFRGRWGSERSLGHYLQIALARQVQVSMTLPAQRALRTLLCQGQRFLFSVSGSEDPPASPAPALLQRYGQLAGQVG